MNDLNAELKEKLEAWRVQGERKVVRVLGVGSGNVSHGQLFVQQWPRKKRLQLAVLALVACWALAVSSVMIPFIDFVSVPFLVILGPFIAWRVYSKTSVILGGLVVCPKCGLTYELSRGRMDFPVHSQCSYCRERAEVLESPMDAILPPPRGLARPARSA